MSYHKNFSCRIWTTQVPKPFPTCGVNFKCAGNNQCHNFETIFLHLWTRSISLLELYSYDQFIQNNGSTISSFLFKSSLEFFILLHFQELIWVLHISILLQVMLAILTFGSYTTSFCPSTLSISLSNMTLLKCMSITGIA